MGPWRIGAPGAPPHARAPGAAAAPRRGRPPARVSARQMMSVALQEPTARRSSPGARTLAAPTGVHDRLAPRCPTLHQTPGGPICYDPRVPRHCAACCRRWTAAAPLRDHWCTIAVPPLLHRCCTAAVPLPTGCASFPMTRCASVCASRICIQNVWPNVWPNVLAAQMAGSTTEASARGCVTRCHRYVTDRTTEFVAIYGNLRPR